MQGEGDMRPGGGGGEPQRSSRLRRLALYIEGMDTS